MTRPRGRRADIVNAMLALDTTVWGDGSPSSSDGQRFLFPQRVLRRTYSHRLGDFALEFYTSLPANYAPFYSCRLSARSGCSVCPRRLLITSPDLDPQEHYTDTRDISN